MPTSEFALPHFARLDILPTPFVSFVMATDSNLSRTSALLRMAWLAFGGVLIGLLITAAQLQPDSRGLGTHQQLGLPPCTFQVLFRMRCPACGMTTAWAHFTHGQLAAALEASVGGTLLAVLALVFGPSLVASGCRGRWIGWKLSEWTIAGAAVTILLVVLVEWGCRLLITGR